jgi:hypothetical protein
MEFLHSSTHSSMALQPNVGPWPLLQFRNLFDTNGRTPWTIDHSVARPLPAHRTTQHRINAHTDIHALGGIRTHDPNFRASEDSSFPRPLDHLSRFLIMQFSPAYYYFLSLRFRYSPHYSVLKHSQSVFFTYSS